MKIRMMIFFGGFIRGRLLFEHFLKFYACSKMNRHEPTEYLIDLHYAIIKSSALSPLLL
jgi:hypothetical protein